jgi:hypothetical protein
MIINKVKMQTDLKYILGKIGLLPMAQQIRKLLTPKSPYERERHQRFLRFKRQFGNALRYNLNGSGHEQQKKVLVCGAGYWAVEAELGLIKSLELAGYVPVVLMHRSWSLELQYYKLAVRHILFWDDFLSSPDIDIQL